jgi:hypothetical protein
MYGIKKLGIPSATTSAILGRETVFTPTTRYQHIPSSVEANNCVRNLESRAALWLPYRYTAQAERIVNLCIPFHQSVKKELS